MQTISEPDLGWAAQLYPLAGGPEPPIDPESSRWRTLVYPRFDVVCPPYPFVPLASALLRLTGAEWDHDLAHGSPTRVAWPVSRCAVHQITRSLWRASKSLRPTALKMVLAYLGGEDDLSPFMTDTVVALLRPSRRAVFLPVVADALQDAGLPEEHPILARCRDESVPFMKSEWLHRFALKRRAQRG